MDDAVAANNVGLHDIDGVALCVSDRDLAVLHVDGEFRSIDSLDLAGLDVLGQNLACNNVVGEDRLELLRGQRGDCSGGKLGKRLIGRGEDGERAFA